jgi:hypothetical protein
LEAISGPLTAQAVSNIAPTVRQRLHARFASRQAWLRDLPARSALRLCNHIGIRHMLGLRHARAVERHRAPVLSGIDARIVDALNRDGIFVTSLSALGLGAHEMLLEKGMQLADRYAAEARMRAARGAPFLYIPPDWLAEHPEFFAWGMQDRLLDIAEAYIGLPPAYDGVCINYTVADGREVATRKWHRDWEDRRMLKVAVYLHGVDAQGGPFQMIKRHDSAQSDVHGYRYDLASDADLVDRLGDDYHRDIVSCEGEGGTVIFTDTARFFHRGKPATARDRAAIFYSYFAERPRHPFLCERTGMARRDIARLAAMMPARQQRAALWRDRLPLLLRMIPPARL